MSANSDDVQRAIGNIEGQLRASETARREHRAEMARVLSDQNQKLDSIVRYIERQKGAKAILMTMAGSVGGIAGILVSWFTSRHG